MSVSFDFSTVSASMVEVLLCFCQLFLLDVDGRVYAFSARSYQAVYCGYAYFTCAGELQVNLLFFQFRKYFKRKTKNNFLTNYFFNCRLRLLLQAWMAQSFGELAQPGKPGLHQGVPPCCFIRVV